MGSSKLVSAQVRILMRMGQLHQTWIGLALLIFCLASPSFQSQDYNDEENPAVNTNDADVFGYYGPPSNYLENNISENDKRGVLPYILHNVCLTLCTNVCLTSCIR